MARRAPSLAAAVLMTAPTLLALLTMPASAVLTVDAPGWTVITPGTSNRSGINIYVPGDANGDGFDDLVLVYTPKFSFGPGTFAGDGAFDLYKGSSQGLIAQRASTTALADVSLFTSSAARPPKGWDTNGDSLADVAFVQQRFAGFGGGDSSSTVYKGGIAPYAAVPDCTVAGGDGSSPFDDWARAGDLNGDGHAEIVALRAGGFPGPPPGPPGNNSAPTQSVAIYNGSAGCPGGTRAQVVPFVVSSGASAILLGSADFNHDGFDDLALDAATTAAPGVSTHHILAIYGGSGFGSSGTLTGAVPVAELRASSSAVFMAGPDMNADGFPDLVVSVAYASGFSGEFFDLLYYAGGPTGLASERSSVWTLQGPELASATASYGDVNGDGQVDVALAHANRSADTERITVEVFLGVRGTFGGIPDWISRVTSSGVTGDAFLAGTAVIDASGDLDGDGLDDLALLAGSNLLDFEGPGGGTPESSSAILIYYGHDLVDNLTRLVPVGFRDGVAYPTYEYGFDLSLGAESASEFATISVETAYGLYLFRTNDTSFSFVSNASVPGGPHVFMHGTSSGTYSTSTGKWTIAYRFEFNWSYPTEDPVAFWGSTTRGGALVPLGPKAGGTFRVEKDLELGGSLALTNATDGRALAPGAWVTGGASLRANGLTVHFEAAPEVSVPPTAFQWTYADDEDVFGVSGAGVGMLEVAFSAAPGSDLSQNLTVGVESLVGDDVGADSASFYYRIDADLPTFGAAFPSASDWMAVTDTTVAVLVLDPLSGADPTRAQVQISTAGPGAYGPWTDATVEGSDLTHATARASASFVDGETNYFRFQVWDAAGNGPVVSGDFQVRVDSLHVVFVDPAPEDDVWQREATANASVTVRDLGASGVNGATVECRVSTTGLFGYGPWLPVAGLTTAIEIRPSRVVGLDEGSENFVQWRAEDVAGSGLRASEPFRIISDRTAPTFGELTPEPTVRVANETIEVALNFTDGGPANRSKSGLDASLVEYRFQAAGSNWSAWRVGLTVIQTVSGNWTARIALRLAPGPGNQLEVRASDRAGNGPAVLTGVSYHLNRAPHVEILGGPANGHAVALSLLRLSLNSSDPDGDPLTVTWFGEGDHELANNTTEWSVRVPLGASTIRVQVADEYGGTAEAVLLLEGAAVGPPPPPPALTDGGLPWLLIAVLAAAIFAAYRYRRRRDESGFWVVF